MKKTYLKKKICKLYRIISNPPYYQSKSNMNITLRSEKRRKFRVKELCLQKAMIPLPKKEEQTTPLELFREAETQLCLRAG